MTHTCTNCQTVSTLPLNMVWEGFACVKCNSYFNQQNGQIVYSHAFSGVWDAPSTLDIGDKTTIDGKVFQITGYSKQATIPDAETWCEYYLINARGELRFLSVYENQWTLAQETNEARHAFVNNTGVTTHEGTYRLESTGEFKTVYARGFFKDTIPAGKRVSRDFTAPPYSMLLEIDGDGVHQYRAKQLSHKELRDMFPKLPPSSNVNTASEIFSFEQPYESIIITVCTIFLLTLIMAWQGGSTELCTLNLSVGSNQDTSVTSSQFELLDNVQMVTVNASSTVSNNWIEVSAGLTNIETNEEYYATDEIDYYEGVDAGEYWTEGASSTSMKFCGVPKGKYVATIYGYSPQENSISIFVRTGGYSFYAYIVAIVVLAILLYFIISKIPKDDALTA